MKVLILSNFMDGQTAFYILNSFRDFSSSIAGTDIRRIIKELGMEKGQKVILEELDDLDFVPDLILVLKGLEILPLTLQKIKDKFPKAKICNWFFDKYLHDKPIWDTINYYDVIKMYDYYFCSLKGVADKLRNIGFENAYYLDEACYPKDHGEVYLNHFQKDKYGEDIAFIGNLGYLSQHSNRIPILNHVAKEGFNLKVWGNIICEWKHIPIELREHCMNEEVINENHSRTVQSSLINIGIDQDNTLDMGNSARMYRVMAAGGLYLLNATKGVDKHFKVNKDGAKITGDEELIFYYSYDDLVNKLDFLLEHDEIREKIAKNGQKIILEKHKFSDRIKEMLEIINVKK